MLGRKKRQVLPDQSPERGDDSYLGMIIVSRRESMCRKSEV